MGADRVTPREQEPDLCPACFAHASSRGMAGPAQRACAACGFDVSAELSESQGELAVGTSLRDRYRVGRVLGRGGFGITYLAWDMRLRRRRALKEYFPSGLVTREAGELAVTPGQTRPYEAGRAKYLEEARLLAQFERDPCIVSPLDYFEENGTAYLVMEYLEGETLASYVARQGGRIPYAHAVHYLAPVLEALGSVHRAGILHRDVSPENIFLTSDGHAKLIDFGAARQRLAGETGALTVILREHFAPPEQYMATGRQGPWTDIYAFAASLYLAITGQPPPPAPERWLDHPLRPPRRLGADIPPDAERALLRALSLRAEDRPQQVEELLPALLREVSEAAGRVAGASIAVRAIAGLATLVRRLGATSLRSPGLAAILTGTALAVMLGGLAFWGADDLGAPGSGAAGTEVESAPGVAAGAVERTEPAAPEDRPDGRSIRDDPVPAVAQDRSAPQEGGEPAALASAPALAELIVRSPLVGDTLFIDGEPRGSTGGRVHRLEPGTHRVRVTKNGFVPFEIEIDLAADGSPRVVQAELDLDVDSLRDRLARVQERLERGSEDERRAALRQLRVLAEVPYDPAMRVLATRLALEREAAGEGPEAERWVRRAAQRGIPEAQYLWGLRLELGDWPPGTEGVPEPPSPFEGARSWMRAARELLPGARLREFVRELREYATAGSASDLGAAAEMHLAAARSGHAGAQARLGYMYASGRGRERNAEAAFYWLLKSAQSGNVGAQYAVGMCYLAGEGYIANPAAGHCWLRRASAGGHPRAQGELDRLGVPATGPAPERCDYPPLSAPAPR